MIFLCECMFFVETMRVKNTGVPTVRTLSNTRRRDRFTLHELKDIRELVNPQFLFHSAKGQFIAESGHIILQLLQFLQILGRQ